MSSERWHTAQFLKRIGATSLLKVVCLFDDLLFFALMAGGMNKQNAAKAIKGIARYLDLILPPQESSTKPHEGTRRIRSYLRVPSCGFLDSLYLILAPMTVTSRRNRRCSALSRSSHSSNQPRIPASRSSCLRMSGRPSECRRSGSG